MARQRYALILLLGLVLTPVARGQSSLTPEAGVLVLRNGQILKGEATRAGDYYIVTLGESGELRLPAADVEAFCGSLDEAYEFKQRHLSGPGAKPHLDLAEWCLRHGLFAGCADQLAAAMRLEPNNERVLQLDRRLKLAVETPPAVTEPAPSATAGISAEQLEKSLQGLPKGSVEKFSANIQPILLNRCAANQCHGPNAKSEFRLLRPPPGQIATRRFTQRNLYATLQYLDPSNPEASPLLTMPQRRHGTALTAVFDKHTQNQLAELSGWAKMTVTAPRPAAPPTIRPTQPMLAQPAAAAASADSSGALTAPSAGAAEVHVMRPAFDAAADAPPAAGPARFVPRDRFDPEIFNRRYHGGK